MIAIDRSKCTACGACLAVCPWGALSLTQGSLILDTESCRSCDLCADACPAGALRVISPVAAAPAAELPVVVEPIAVAPVVRRPQWRETLLPAVSTVVGFAVREVLPLLVNVAVARATPLGVGRTAAGAAAALGAGRRHRRRGGA